MIKEAKTQSGEIVTPVELATYLPPIPKDHVFMAATSATTGYWTGNFWDSDTVED